jgi:hypothetical protein
VCAILLAKHVFDVQVHAPAPGIILGAAISLVLGLIDDWRRWAAGEARGSGARPRA